MQAEQQFKRIPVQQAANLPRLISPAGYVVVIQDVDYGNRFKFAQLPQLNRDQLRRVVDLSIETRIALILEAENAARVALDLHDRFMAQGRPGDWFDLDAAQIKELDDIGRPQAPSLRELALNDMGAESLVQDAKIVRTTPELPFSHLQRREKRPARRLSAWVLLFLIVLLLTLAVTQRTELRREIARLLENSAQQSEEGRVASTRVMPTATAVPGQGEVFYVRYPARVRSCASTSCQSSQTLEVGFRLVALRYQRGEAVRGEATWVVFEHRGKARFVHRSLLTTKAPTLPTTEPPTSVPASAVPGQGQILYVMEGARARTCASTTCRTTETLAAGARIVALRYETGQALDGDTTWVKFISDGTLAYVHRSLVGESPPTSKRPAQAAPAASSTAAPTQAVTPATTVAASAVTAEATAMATDTPTDAPTATFAPTATETAIPVRYVETANDLNARVRACPSTDCDILGRLSPGSEVAPLREVEGEVVNGNALWTEFDFDGETAFIHSGLLTEAP